MLHEEKSRAPEQPISPPVWSSQPADDQGPDADDEEWGDYELEEPSDEDDELDDEDEIENWDDEEE